MSLRLLDLYCGAGGCSVGYARAGFQVVGVDIVKQRNYPYKFHQADAINVLTRWASDWFSLIGSVDAIHASPPCQAYSKAQRIRQRHHPDLIGPTRQLLDATGLPYVIENVPGAPLQNYVVLEGQMFDGLRTQRTRWFETNWPLDVPFLRSPRPAPMAKMGRKARAHEWVHVVGNAHSPDENRKAMGIDHWMTRAELSEAIPPAYTEYIGQQLMAHLQQQEKHRAMFTIDEIRIEGEEDGFHLVIYAENADGAVIVPPIRYRIGLPDQFDAEVRRTIGRWLAEGERVGYHGSTRTAEETAASVAREWWPDNPDLARDIERGK